MIEKSAIFSPNRKYRYTIERHWKRKKGHVLFCCLNPSTADENIDDPTIRRCIRFSEFWGYGGMVMVNIFALRSPHPRTLYDCDDPVGLENDKYIELMSNGSDITVCGWGVWGKLMNRGNYVVKKLLKNPKCLRITKDGFPGHPLYLKKTSKIIDYRPS